MDFHTHTLSAERLPKEVLRNIPIEISTDELQAELTALNFNVRLTRWFGSAEKPVPLCLVSLSGANAKDIFELNELFYIKISVKPFKKSGPSQFQNC